MIISSITPPAVPFAQGQDARRLRAVVGRTATEVKHYTIQYEEQRKMVEAFGTRQSAPESKSFLDIAYLNRGSFALMRPVFAKLMLSTTSLIAALRTTWLHIHKRQRHQLWSLRRYSPLLLLPRHRHLHVSPTRKLKKEATGASRRVEGFRM